MIHPHANPPELLDEASRRQQLHLREEHGTAFPSTYAALGLCQLNQWALDFEGNLRRIQESIRQVKAKGGYFRLGPELEVSGYSCDDHFNEIDTTAMCWQSINDIVRSDLSHNCLLDIGMPVEHKSVRYNCRVYILNKEILLIRPKMFLAGDGAYRESRWFGTWNTHTPLDTFILPKSVQRVIRQKTCPIGFAAIQCNDCLLAAESCEELFVPESPHLALCLGGVEIFANGSASYFEMNKLKNRLDLIMAPTQKMGGVYMYSNMKGNDGGKIQFDGHSFIACNGDVVNIMTSLEIGDVEVMVERVNISTIRSFRACKPSYNIQASSIPVRTIPANIWLSGIEDSSVRTLSVFGHRELTSGNVSAIVNMQEELARNLGCWLWDYLRRSHAQGFFVPLSGGLDSAAVAASVCYMCSMVMDAVRRQTPGVISDVEKVLKIKRDAPEFPGNAKALCSLVLHTAYMGMKHSSHETRDRAGRVASQLGSYHMAVDIDDIVDAEINIAQGALGLRPRYLSQDKKLSGSFAEDRALQNVQARSRMVLAYMLASLLPTVRARDRLAPAPMNFSAEQKQAPLSDEQEKQVGYLLVLATGNIDEGLRGYLTKFDCSSGDLSPIGSLAKVHLRHLVDFLGRALHAFALFDILAATPTAELRPDEEGQEPQADEAEMGLTYPELYILGQLRKTQRCGPVEMFETLMHRWRASRVQVDLGEASPSRTPKHSTTIEDDQALYELVIRRPELTPKDLAEKVKHFFRTYSENRHKTTTLPPSLHAEAYDPDHSRYDWRPFLYPGWACQFRQIDALADLAEASFSEQGGINRIKAGQPTMGNWHQNPSK